MAGRRTAVEAVCGLCTGSAEATAKTGVELKDIMTVGTMITRRLTILLILDSMDMAELGSRCPCVTEGRVVGVRNCGGVDTAQRGYIINAHSQLVASLLVVLSSSSLRLTFVIDVFKADF